MQEEGQLPSPPYPMPKPPKPQMTSVGKNTNDTDSISHSLLFNSPQNHLYSLNADAQDKMQDLTSAAVTAPNIATTAPSSSNNVATLKRESIGLEANPLEFFNAKNTVNEERRGDNGQLDEGKPLIPMSSTPLNNTISPNSRMYQKGPHSKSVTPQQGNQQYYNTPGTTDTNSSKMSTISSHTPHSSQPSDAITVDRLDQLAEYFIQKCRYPPIDINSVNSDLEGLQLLSHANCWKKALQISSELMSAPSLTATVEINNKVSLNIIHQIRFQGLFQMKLFDDLAQEISSILSLFDCEQSVENAGVDSPHFDLVYSLTIIIIEVRMMTGNNQIAIEQLYKMQHILESLPGKSESINYWKLQVKLDIINGMFRLRQYPLALKALTSLIKEIETEISNEKDEEKRISLAQIKIVLLIREARTVIQIGNIKRARVGYDNMKKELKAIEEKVDTKNFNLKILENHFLLIEALLNFVENNIEEAAALFLTVANSNYTKMDSDEFSGKLEALKLSNVPSTTPSSTSMKQMAIGLLKSESEDLFVSALNNFSIASLYLKKINVAITKLESLIYDNPALSLVDPVVFNVCTLYDLSYAPDISASKKRVLQRVATLYHIEDPILHWRSFRLN